MYCRDHFADLIAELTPEAEAVAGRVGAALAELRASYAAWHEVAGRCWWLLRGIPGLDGSDLPSLGALDQLVREAKRAAMDGVPPPLPRSLTVDPTIRAA